MTIPVKNKNDETIDPLPTKTGTTARGTDTHTPDPRNEPARPDMSNPLKDEDPLFRVEQPFWDGSQLHPMGTVLAWVKPTDWNKEYPHYTEHGPSGTFTPLNAAAKKLKEDFLRKKFPDTYKKK